MNDGIKRSKENRVIAGIAGGLGKYFSIDPIIIRVLFGISVAFSGIGVLVYLIMWIVIPEDKYDFENFSNNFSTNNENVDSNNNQSNNINFTFPEKKQGNGKLSFGIVLIVIGLFFLGIKIFPFINFADLLPLFFISIGILLLWKSKK